MDMAESAAFIYWKLEPLTISGGQSPYSDGKLDGCTLHKTSSLCIASNSNKRGDWIGTEHIAVYGNVMEDAEMYMHPKRGRPFFFHTVYIFASRWILWCRLLNCPLTGVKVAPFRYLAPHVLDHTGGYIDETFIPKNSPHCT